MTPKMISETEQHFADYMAANHAGVRLVFNNVDIPEDASEYVVFNVLTSEESVPVGLGRTAKSRTVGLVQADVITPSNIGAGTAGDMAQSIANAFARLELPVPAEGHVTFRDPIVRNGEGAGNEFRKTMRVPWTYDYVLPYNNA